MLKVRFLFTGLCLTLGLAACNLPSLLNSASQNNTPTARTPLVIDVTPISITVYKSPNAAVESPPVNTQVEASTPSMAASSSPGIETRTSPTLTGECERAAPGNPLDITIPDDTHMAPGQSFTKTWRLINDGNCAWTQAYALVYFSGSQMSALARNGLPVQVAPGGSVDVSVDMVAPVNPGLYQGNWKLSNPEGRLFGIGPNGDAPIWVRIVVVEEATPTPTFTAVPTQTATPVVYVSGQATLTPADGLDLDSNTVAAPPTSASDIVYTFTDGLAHQLEPVNGANLGSPGSTPNPTYQDCITAKLYSEPLVLDGLALNSTFCYRTSLGLPGWARLVSLDPKTNALTLEILTWAIP